MITKTFLTLTESETAHTTPFAQLNNIVHEQVSYTQVSLPDGAAALIINDAGEILMVQSVRPAVQQISWELPRGGIESGEAPAEAAARELFEETGFQVSPNHLLPLGHINPDSGILSHKIHLFLHKTSQKPSFVIPADPEVKDVRWVHRGRVVSAIGTNEITDGITIATFGKAKLLGIL